MEKDNYHHGALREDLIKKGIELIGTEGMDKFSLRRVAVLCNVSHAAPYKHFKNKEQLIEAIVDYILADFTKEIWKTVEENPGEQCLLEVGKRYVCYMLEHKEYFQLMFQSDIKAKVVIGNGQFIIAKGHPFGAFSEVADQLLAPFLPNEEVRHNQILQFWCSVHGLAHLLLSDIVEYKGDYAQLTEAMLYINSPMGNCSL